MTRVLTAVAHRRVVQPYFVPPQQPVMNILGRGPTVDQMSYNRMYPWKGFAGNIETQTERNNNFRQVVFTGPKEQLVLMSLKPREAIGNEIHKHTDQFIRIEKGNTQFVFGNGSKVYNATAGDSVVIPAGTWHNVINKGKTPAKLYTIYSPPHHPANTVDVTKAAAMRREQHR